MALPMGVLRFGKHIHFTGPAWLATSGKPTQSFAPVPREKMLQAFSRWVAIFLLCVDLPLRSRPGWGDRAEGIRFDHQKTLVIGSAFKDQEQAAGLSAAPRRAVLSNHVANHKPQNILRVLTPKS